MHPRPPSPSSAAAAAAAAALAAASIIAAAGGSPPPATHRSPAFALLHQWPRPASLSKNTDVSSDSHHSNTSLSSLPSAVSGHHALGSSNQDLSARDANEDTDDEDTDDDDFDDDDFDPNDDFDSEGDSADLDPSIETEINDFYQAFPCSDDYFIFDKIGEGTFSSVYKAIDIKHYRYDNPWCLDHVPADQRSRQLFRSELISALRLSRHSNCSVVALKRIYQTSSPERIINEISILKRLSGHPNIAPLVTAIRKDDQVVVVMRYFSHEDFRLFFRDLDTIGIRNYMRALLSGLAFIHSQNLIHRDIKPSNFLYNPKAGTGVIVDFGLAQIEEHKETGRNSITERQNDAKRLMRQYKIAGVFQEDPRPPVRANRAGTRGFRAPEVLLRVVNQTRAIDVWSVGVILLCIASGKFPFFQSIDDKMALLEIGFIFGRKAMQHAASSCRRTFQTNIPTITDRIPFHTLITRFDEHRENILDTDGYDLLNRLLELDPKGRIRAEEALEHPFLRVNTT